MEAIKERPDLPKKIFYAKKNALQHLQENPETDVVLLLVGESVSIKPVSDPYNYDGGAQGSFDDFLSSLRGRPVIDPDDRYASSHRAFRIISTDTIALAEEQEIKISTELVYVKKHGNHIPYCEISRKK